MFNIPVHERLFADHESRKERIMVMAQEENSKFNYCSSKKDIYVENSNPKPPIGNSYLNSYRSTGNLQENL